MVGYPYGKKGWKVYDIQTMEIFVSRNVIVHEDIYPFASNDKEQMIENIGQNRRWVSDEFFDNTKSPTIGILHLEEKNYATSHTRRPSGIDQH